MASDSGWSSANSAHEAAKQRNAKNRERKARFRKLYDPYEGGAAAPAAAPAASTTAAPKVVDNSSDDTAAVDPFKHTSIDITGRVVGTNMYDCLHDHSS
jgi:hypothetical protein